MKEIVLTPKELPKLPIHAEIIKPDAFAGKTIKEIGELKVQIGNKQTDLSEIFSVNGETSEDPSDLRIVIDGDVSRVKRIGEEMKTGEILIKGNAGMFTGARMSGGTLIVEGNADAWFCQEMKGGEAIVKGNAANYVGSSYRGEWTGMKGGKITIEGNAKSDVGEYMSSGTIIVKGDVEYFAGIHMRGGTIIIEGNALGRVGSEMDKGTILVKGEIKNPLPGYKYEGAVKDPEVGGIVHKGEYHKFIADISNPKAKGEIYALADKNNHLLPK
ncbi:MAG: formylmethanofuran dehydrogenase subunit C [Candidatus Hydrothermarchaeota archaeon]